MLGLLRPAEAAVRRLIIVAARGLVVALPPARPPKPARPILRNGIGRLHFAGEYTSYAFMGYMEGALESGAAAARRIAARDGVARLAL